MSWRVSVSCPQCRQSFYVEIWQVIDLAEQPGLRRDLLQGKINIPVCPHCGTVNLLEEGFLVNDPKCERVIFYLPQGETDYLGIQMMSNLLSIAIQPRKRYFSNPVVVSDQSELKRSMRTRTRSWWRASMSSTACGSRGRTAGYGKAPRSRPWLFGRTGGAPLQVRHPGPAAACYSASSSSGSGGTYSSSPRLSEGGMGTGSPSDGPKISNNRL